ncbi:alpha-1A adrenergic receptor-like [Styela clava]
MVDVTTDLINTTAQDRPFSEGGSVVTATLLLMMMIFGIMGNLVTIIVIAASKSLKSVFNLLIISLCVSDLLSAIVSPLALYRRTWGFEEWLLPKEFCNLFMATDIWTSGVTTLHILLFCIIRFISMKWPFNYKNIRKIHVKALVISIWVVALCCGGIPGWFAYKAGKRPPNSKWPACTLDPDWLSQYRIYSKIVFPVFILLPMIAIFILSIAIILLLIKRRTMRSEKKIPPMPEAASKQMENIRRKLQKKENKAILQLSLIGGSFMFGYIPIICYNFYTTTVDTTTIKKERIVDWNFGMISYILLRFSECLNPVFYNKASGKMRKETVSLLRKLSKCQCLRKKKSNGNMIQYQTRDSSSKTGTLQI